MKGELQQILVHGAALRAIYQNLGYHFFITGHLSGSFQWRFHYFASTLKVKLL